MKVSSMFSGGSQLNFIFDRMVQLPNDKKPAETEERRTEVKKIIIALSTICLFSSQIAFAADQKALEAKSSFGEKTESHCVGSQKAKLKKPNGFDRNLDAEKIIKAAHNERGEVFFQIKWSGSEEDHLVPAREANLKIPQLVIKFYEDRLNWYDE